MTRFVFITGGVVSSLGKGLASAAIGALLQARGYSVRLRKLDPYLNVDPGTMSPYQHGEVYVTDDGAETDLDLGHYERFTGVPARGSDSVTAGKIYSWVLAKERHGDYLGGTVQVVPHVTDMIKECILKEVDDTDFVLCEIGGTVGDIEGLPFLEAIRQLGFELGRDRVAYLHLTLVPYIRSAGELKTKPTQHSVRELRGIGIQPDILLCRTEHPIPMDARRKIALQCNVELGGVIPAEDVRSIYEVPIRYHEEGLDTALLRHFRLPAEEEPDLRVWEEITERVAKPEGEVTIAVVGKYMGLQDAYKSLDEALTHGGIANNVKVNTLWLNAEIFEKDDAALHLQDVNAILVPGGFGERGAEGKVRAVTFARERKIPYFGICLGLQMAVIEAARQLAGIEKAASSEFGPSEEPVVGLLTEWEREGALETRSADGDLGGTMRLGAYPCVLAEGTLARQIYGEAEIDERHRHRYEVNINYMNSLSAAGLSFSGMSPDGRLPEIIELPGHPWFLGVQFHPELKSKPFQPHPLFASFVKAALDQSRLV
jgi:CTP synthase